MATTDELKAALLKAHKAGDTRAADLIADLIKKQVLNPKQTVLEEYEAKPWYGKLGTAVDDLARIGAEGASYGALDKALGPEEEKRTKESWERAGLAGYPAYIGGTVFSPITRGIGAVANTVRPVASGIPAMLGRLGVSAGEGAAQAGAQAAIQGEDILPRMATGAALSGGAHVGAKSAATAAKYVAGVLSNKAPDLFSKAFKAGETGGTVADSFLAGQRGKLPVAAQMKYDIDESNLATLPVSTAKLPGLFKTLKDGLDVKGISKISNASKNKVNKMGELVDTIVNDPTVQTFDAARHNLKQYAKSNDTQVKRVATTLQDAIRQEVQKVEPNYLSMLSNYEQSKIAHDAGKKLSKALAFAPGSLDVPKALAGSPHGLGYTAQALGRANRYLPKNKYGLMGLFAPQFDKDRR